MISEKTSEDEHLLTAWVIHFSLAGCTTSAFREKLKNPSNIHFWESTICVESGQFDFIYFLTQIFLTKDIETLQRIILEPEEIHELVQQTAFVRNSLNESGEFDEASYRTEIDRLPYVRRNFIDERCISIELLVTDLFDPEHNLRELLRDLRTSGTVTRNETQEGRDSFCVTSHNSTKDTREEEDSQSPCFQKFKESRRKRSRNWGHTVVEEDIITSQSPSKSQKTNNAEKNSPQITPKKSRKRRNSSCHRKSFNGKIPKMNTIDTYFKPVPRKTRKMNTIDTYFKPVPTKIQRQCDIENKEENKRSNSSELEICIIEDDDFDELTGNWIHKEHTGRQKHNSVIIDDFQEDSISLTGKTRTSVPKPIEMAGSDTEICMTREVLQDCHTKQVTKLSASNAEELAKNSTLTTPAICSESHDAQTTEKTHANNIDLNHNVKNTFKLDAATRNLIRDWCGGDTFLTQGSFSSSEEVMEKDNRTTDDDDDDDDADNVNKQHSQNNSDNIDDDDDIDDGNVFKRDFDGRKGHANSGKSDTENDEREESDDDDDDDDSDDDNVINRALDDHKGHGDCGGHGTDNDKSEDSGDDDDDNDDSDDDSGNDHASDEDYIYISDDKSDSEEDDNYKQAKKKSL
ncbi:uncharacterized protein LOC144651703 [Oculina patagonica]